MKNKLLFLVLTVFLISLVTAQPPGQQSSIDRGLVLESAFFELHEQNKPLYVHTHVYNASNGIPHYSSVANGIGCRYHAYSNNQNSEHIINNGTMSAYGVGWNSTIPANYFNETGKYSILIWCNNSLDGGFIEYSFNVTPNRSILDTPTSLIYIFILAILFIGLGFSIYSINKADKGEWQIAYICISYILLFSLTFMAWLISKNYLYELPILESTFWITWLTLSILFFPFILGISAYILKKQGEALLVADYQKQGYSKEDSLSMSK